ncbi:MAG: hypothetical protein EP297_01975, partial [Gammaproteobacteria bacterium]
MRPVTDSLSRWVVHFLLLFTVLPVQALEQITIQVGQLNIDDVDITNISLETRPSETDKDQFTWSGHVNLQNTTFHANGYIDNRQWQADIKSDPDGEELVELQHLFKTEMPEIAIDGSTQLSVKAYGTVDRMLQGASFKFAGKQWTAEIPDMAIAMEQANFQISGDVTLTKNQDYHGTASIQLDSGLYAFNDVFIEPTQGAIQFSSQYAYRDEELLLQKGKLHDPGGLTVRVPRLRYRANEATPLADMKVEIAEARFPYVYSAWVQGLLYDTLLADVDSDGSIHGAISMSRGDIDEVNLTLENFSLSDTTNKFALYRANGNFFSQKG